MNDWHSRHYRAALLCSLCLLLLAAGCSGCRKPGSSATTTKKARRADASAQWSDDLFTYAIDNVNRLEDSDATELREGILQRLNSIRHAGQLPPDVRGDPLAATWPEPEMLVQVVARLNQWIENQPPQADWKLDPMLDALLSSSQGLAKVRDLEMVRNLDKMQFISYDGFSMMEAVWLRDLSAWARGKTTDELQQARQLFDWTARNIQLDPDGPDHVPQVPWETLLLGHGTAMERAWVYILLLRQQGIDAAMLALPMVSVAPLPLGKVAIAQNDSSDAASRLRPWCVAVLTGAPEAKKLYLFDPALGLPIPAPGGLRVDGKGALDIQPATLEQVRTDRSLLDRLDFDAGHPYWVKSAELKQIVVAVEASPPYLAKRMKLVESRLVGQKKMVLSAAPTAQAERLKTASGVQQVRLWNWPYLVLQRRQGLALSGIIFRLDEMLPLYAAPAAPLYRGRILHLKGRFLDSQGAIECYQSARPPTKDLVDDEPRRAKAYYETMLDQMKKAPPEQLPQIKSWAKEEADLAARFETHANLEGKLNASFWLGMVAFEQGNYPSAIDYFSKRTLEASPTGRWASAARYNLGRCEEALGHPKKAIEEYQAGIFSPGDYGSVLRARWLNELSASGEKKATPKSK